MMSRFTLLACTQQNSTVSPIQAVPVRSKAARLPRQTVFLAADRACMHFWPSFSQHVLLTEPAVALLLQQHEQVFEAAVLMYNNIAATAKHFQQTTAELKHEAGQQAQQQMPAWLFPMPNAYVCRDQCAALQGLLDPQRLAQAPGQINCTANNILRRLMLKRWQTLKAWWGLPGLCTLQGQISKRLPRTPQCHRGNPSSGPLSPLPPLWDLDCRLPFHKSCTTESRLSS